MQIKNGGDKRTHGQVRKDEHMVKLLTFLLVSSAVDQKNVEFSPRLNEIQNLAFNKILSFRSVFPIIQKIKIKKNDN